MILTIIYSSHFQFPLDEKYIKLINNNIFIFLIILVLLWEQKNINLRYSIYITTCLFIILYILNNYKILDKLRDITSRQISLLVKSFYTDKKLISTEKNKNETLSPIDYMRNNYTNYANTNIKIKPYINQSSNLLG